MVKVQSASGFARAEVKRTADIFRGQIVDVTASQYTVQLAGTSEKLDAFIQAIIRSDRCGRGSPKRGRRDSARGAHFKTVITLYDRKPH